ncbi:MAG: 50S ribosomal protein L11 methyltransferase [Ignavibacteria bacterium]|nr:50S ribosomal protein L11 methyltransferase [Ignavibacteria bacterium]
MLKKFINVKFSLLEEFFPYFYVVIENYNIEGIEELFDEIIVCFQIDNWNDKIKFELLSALRKYIPEVKIISEEIIEDRNWNEEIEQNTPIIKINDKIGIAPQWKIEQLDTEIKIIINPKMSFGTGQHSTTKLVCLLLAKNVHSGDFWIDAGTGTGVLAILAKKLGASKVYAFDYGEWSVLNARENFMLNDIDGEYIIEQQDIFEINLPSCDGIVANMFLNILEKTIDKFHSALKERRGHLILSGILKYDKDYLIGKYCQNYFEHIETLEEDEWVAIHLRAK